MPKYLKDAKLEVWKRRDAYQDEAGAWHEGEAYKAGTVWGNLKGVDYSEFYALHARWAEPTFKATVTRPSWEIEVGDHIKHREKFYTVKSIDELTGKVGRDMKLTCQLDSRFVSGNEEEGTVDRSVRPSHTL